MKYMKMKHAQQLEEDLHGSIYTMKGLQGIASSTIRSAEPTKGQRQWMTRINKSINITYAGFESEKPQVILVLPSPWWCSIHHHPDHQVANLHPTCCFWEGVDPGERNVKYTENEMTIWNKWQWNMPNNRRKMSTEASTPWKGCKALHHPQSDQ